jgi:hypothetical protein
MYVPMNVNQYRQQPLQLLTYASLLLLLGGVGIEQASEKLRTRTSAESQG